MISQKITIEKRKSILDVLELLELLYVDWEKSLQYLLIKTFKYDWKDLQILDRNMEKGIKDIIQSLKVIFIGSGNILGKIAWKVSRTPEMKRLIKKNDQIVVKF